MQLIFDVHYSDVARKLNKYIADNCDGIVSCMYDYYVGYNEIYKEKLINIPLPIDMKKIDYADNVIGDKVNVFFGLQKARIEWKGSNIILKALEEIQSEYPSKIEIKIVESVPYNEYVKMFSEANLFFDQTYLYSQGMNGLLALAAGKVLFGGGEPENYSLNNEQDNFPIVNITADIPDIKNKIVYFLNNPDATLEIGRNSHEYVKKHHESMKVARQYLDFYESI